MFPTVFQKRPLSLSTASSHFSQVLSNCPFGKTVLQGCADVEQPVGLVWGCERRVSWVKNTSTHSILLLKYFCAIVRAFGRVVKSPIHSRYRKLLILYVPLLIQVQVQYILYKYLHKCLGESRNQINSESIAEPSGSQPLFPKRRLPTALCYCIVRTPHGTLGLSFKEPFSWPAQES